MTQILAPSQSEQVWTPDSAVAALRTGGQRRSEAYAWLTGFPGDPGVPLEVTTRAVQLDKDAELEVVLTTSAEQATTVCVLDRGAKGWEVAGAVPSVRGAVVDYLEATRAGAKDLAIRTEERGITSYRVNVMIFRLGDGGLRSAGSFIESLEGYSIGSELTLNGRLKVGDGMPPRDILYYQTKKAKGKATTNCAVLSFRPGPGAFQVNEAASVRQCGSGLREIVW